MRSEEAIEGRQEVPDPAGQPGSFPAVEPSLSLLLLAVERQPRRPEA